MTKGVSRGEVEGPSLFLENQYGHDSKRYPKKGYEPKKILDTPLHIILELLLLSRGFLWSTQSHRRKILFGNFFDKVTVIKGRSPIANQQKARSVLET